MDQSCSPLFPQSLNASLINVKSFDLSDFWNATYSLSFCFCKLYRYLFTKTNHYLTLHASVWVWTLLLFSFLHRYCNILLDRYSFNCQASHLFSFGNKLWDLSSSPVFWVAYLHYLSESQEIFCVYEGLSPLNIESKNWTDTYKEPLAD